MPSMVGAEAEAHARETFLYFLSEVTFLTRLCPSISLHVEGKES